MITLGTLFLIRLLLVSKVISPIHYGSSNSYQIYHLLADTPGYIDPWKNVIFKGIYSKDGQHPTADRMPYTGFLFFLTYLVVSDDVIAYSIVAILQILLGTFVTILMANLCYQICLDVGLNKKIALYSGITYVILSTIWLNNLFYDSAIMPDGPATSFLGLFVFHYYYYLSQDEKSSKNFILSSVFLAITCLFRPYYVLLYPIIALFEVYKSKGIFMNLLWKKILVLIIPITLLYLPWIIRNYITFGRFIPAQSDIYAGTCDRVCRAFRSFMRIADGTGSEFQPPNSMAFYFNTKGSSTSSLQIPSYLLGERLNMKEIEKAKLLYDRYRENKHDPLLEDSVIQAFYKLVSYYRQDHPYLHWLYPRLVCLRSFFIHGAAAYSISFRDGLKKFNKFFFLSVRISQALLYYTGLIGGIIGLVRLTRKRIETYMLLLIPMYLTLLFPIYLLTDESRYFWAAYPILLIGASIQIVLIAKSVSLWRPSILERILRHS